MDDLELFLESITESSLSVIDKLNAKSIYISREQEDVINAVDQNCRTIKRIRRNPHTGEFETIYITICE